MSYMIYLKLGIFDLDNIPGKFREETEKIKKTPAIKENTRNSTHNHFGTDGTVSKGGDPC